MSLYLRTVIRIELLTEEDSAQVAKLKLESLDLEQIVYEMTHGDASGKVTVESSVAMSGQEMAKLLRAQDSDPRFLGLDDAGNKVE